jgi:thioredoxin reductase
MDTDSTTAEVAVIGGGVAGLSAGVFTARADFDTLVIDAGGSILRRNAHLENFPGFPAGIDARLFLDLLREQADRAGCRRVDGTVTRLLRTGSGSAPTGGDRNPSTQPRFTVETATGDRYGARYVVAATKNAVDYLADLSGVELVERGKSFVVTDERGRTGVPGLFAAGRLAGKPHQAVVSAGHGAEVAVTLLEDDDRPFYHDWVTPEGYFTDRGRDLPPGCAEIGDAERERRDAEARALLRDRLAEPHPSEQPTHPSLADE